MHVKAREALVQHGWRCSSPDLRQPPRHWQRPGTRGPEPGSAPQHLHWCSRAGAQAPGHIPVQQATAGPARMTTLHQTAHPHQLQGGRMDHMEPARSSRFGGLLQPPCQHPGFAMATEMLLMVLEHAAAFAEEEERVKANQEPAAGLGARSPPHACPEQRSPVRCPPLQPSCATAAFTSSGKKRNGILELIGEAAPASGRRTRRGCWGASHMGSYAQGSSF